MKTKFPGLFSKTRTASVLICFVTAHLFTQCVREDHAHMQMYIVEIIDDGAGQCTYEMNKTKEGTAAEHILVCECGRWQVGERIFVPETEW